ncbi:MAG TPA: DUF4147 domain-containing protein [Steroidobacteraceae bacterium]|nr:DUF4147 domain-containing protein [Steroidobacteraceae bacterium]
MARQDRNQSRMAGQDFPALDVTVGSSEPRRRILLDLLQAGLARVEGRACVARALSEQVDASPAGRSWVFAIGKAASAMALGARDALGVRLQRVLLITKDGHVAPQARLLPGVEIHEGAHPIPDQRSLEAGQRLLHWLAEMPDSVEPLFLISGGASSLVEVLEDHVSVSQWIRLNTEGMSSGIGIEELNARRRRLSRIKGGKLCGRLAGREAQALFISDVPGNDPSIIGSGLLGSMQGMPDKVERKVIASLEDAIEAVSAEAEAMKLDVRKTPQRFDDDAARLAVRFTHELHLHVTQVCVWGGESTVNLPEHPGRGGRNQHLALAAARLIAGQPNMLLLAAGTDGTDGPTEDAGALVDADTCARLSLAGLEAEDCIRRADAGTALDASGDLVHTGPTGTNVGDLVIGLKLSAAAAAIVLEDRGTPGSRVV